MSMSAQIPTMGQIVHYTLTIMDASFIQGSRGPLSGKGGNEPQAGDIVPLMITKTWGDEPSSAFNGQAFLDGNDTLWVTSTSIGEGPGKCQWPPRV